MADTASAQPKLNAEDPMAGMAHSEAHYFNRYVWKTLLTRQWTDC